MEQHQLVTVSNPALGIASERAVGIASIGANSSGFNQVNSIFVSNPGENYDNTATVTIADPETISGIGTYLFNEVVQGMRSGTQARVKNWDEDTKILKLVMLESERLRLHSSQVKMLKDWNLEQYILFLSSLMTLPINTMKETSLSQRQT